MLVKGLRAVEKRASPLVAPAFFLRLMSEDGVGLQTEGCVTCGRTDELVSVDLELSGVCCQEHRSGIPLSEAALELLQAILGGHNPGRRVEFPPSGTVPAGSYCG